MSTYEEWYAAYGLNFLEIMGCIFIGLLIGLAMFGIMRLVLGPIFPHDVNSTNKKLDDKTDRD